MTSKSNLTFNDAMFGDVPSNKSGAPFTTGAFPQLTQPDLVRLWKLGAQGGQGSDKVPPNIAAFVQKVLEHPLSLSFFGALGWGTILGESQGKWIAVQKPPYPTGYCQFIRMTRNDFIKRQGIDPWAGPVSNVVSMLWYHKILISEFKRGVFAEYDLSSRPDFVPFIGKRPSAYTRLAATVRYRYTVGSGKKFEDHPDGVSAMKHFFGRGYWKAGCDAFSIPVSLTGDLFDPSALADVETIDKLRNQLMS